MSLIQAIRADEVANRENLTPQGTDRTPLSDSSLFLLRQVSILFVPTGKQVSKKSLSPCQATSL